jgi:hypothetical protein
MIEQRQCAFHPLQTQIDNAAAQIINAIESF